MLDILREKRRQTGERLLKVVDDLDDGQLAWRPSPKAHSIGFTLWHTVRADDNVQADLAGRELEWVVGKYAAKWSHPERGVGTGWDDEKAATLPLPPKAELLAYARDVLSAVDSALADIDESRFGERITSRFMGGESTRGEVVVVSLTHDNRHLGEIEYIKGLQGMRGSVTT